MIPVIGTAVVNSTHFVTRLVYSVDYPVDNFVIVNNNGRGELDESLAHLQSMKHDFIRKIVVINLPANLGCAGAWNLIIKLYMNSPLWIICNDDIAFTPGLLQEMVEESNNPEIGMVHPNSGDFSLGTFDLFLLKDWVVQTYGLFDENCYPAYCEDADYLQRFVHKPLQRKIGLKHTFLHGFGEAKEYYTNGSLTRKRDESLDAILLEANKMNIDYLTGKWGEGWRKMWPSTTPWSDEHSIRDTSYDLEFVRKKYTKF